MPQPQTRFVFTRDGATLPEGQHAITDVVFDADGTLIDSMATYAKHFGRAMREFGITGGEEYMTKTAGTPLQIQARQMFFDHSMQDHSDEVVARHLQLIEGVNFPVYPDAERLVGDLRRVGCHIYISTGNASEVVERELGHAGLADLFTRVLASDLLPKSVAHIETFAKTRGKSLADFAEHAVFIGDGPTDMEIAEKAGMLAIGISRTVDARTLYLSGADAVFPDLSGVYEYVGGLR